MIDSSRMQAVAGLMAASVLLSGCAAAGEQLLQRAIGGHVSGDASQALVQDMPSAADALPLAIAHCTRFGKKAQFARRAGQDHLFRCTD